MEELATQSGVMDATRMLERACALSVPSKLPQLGHGLGSAIKNFKRASQGEDEIEVSKKKELSSGSSAKASLEAGDDDDEIEEVVVRRRKAKAAGKDA